MTRKKSRLSLRPPKKRQRSNQVLQTLPAKYSNKRKHLISPFKSPSSSSIRSPFRSPLYKSSPAPKKAKRSARSLFAESSAAIIHEDGSEITIESGTNGQTKYISNGNTVLNPNDTHFEMIGDHEDNTYSNESTSYSDNQLQRASVQNDIAEMLPSVLNILADENRLDLTLLSFLRQIKEMRFPLDNISFLLWCDVVQWFDCRSTTNMRYSKETKLFWKLGYRLFGERFVTFMGGLKNHGEIILNVTEAGQFSPTSSDINFAVPSPKILRSFDPFCVQGERTPGLYRDIMSVLGKNLESKSACLTFDGKKIKQGLSDDSGDVDLLGFEKNESLTQRQERLQEDLDHITSIKTCLEELEANETSIALLPPDCKEKVHNFLSEKLAVISSNIFRIQDLKRRKEYCKAKLIEKGGEEDWRKSKYVFAISAVIAFLHDIDEFLSQGREITEKLCKFIAFLNGSNITVGEKINLRLTDKYVEIDETTEELNTRLIKQRTDRWQEIRSKAKVTGSTLFGALGCETLTRQKHHFDKVICGIPEKEPKEEIKQAMQHGIDNEQNGVATVVGKVLPVLEPALIFCEEGCITIGTDKQEIFMVISPDGSLRKDSSLQGTCVAVEIKCPVRSVHTELPPRYLLQCLSEIEALDTAYLLFVSWMEDESTVFKVERDSHLFQKAMKLAMQLYDCESFKRPVKLTEIQKDLKNEIITRSKQVPLIGRFKSCKNADCENVYDNDEYTVKKLKQFLGQVTDLTKYFYQLQRERATEAVVFLVADLDRSWKKEEIRCAPVAWFPKGYSLNGDTMRAIAENVHDECHLAGIHIPCSSFDGQWHSLVVRSLKGDALTLLQLQKLLWQDVEKMKKKDIVDGLKALNKDPEWMVVMKPVNNDINAGTKKVIEVTNNGTRLPKYRPVRRHKVTEVSEEHNTIESVTLAETVPIIISASEGEDVLAMTTVSDGAEKEIFACNVNEEDWAQELNEVQTHKDSDTEADNTPCTEVGRTSSVGMHCQDRATVTEFSNFTEKISQEDIKCILNLLKTSKNCNKRDKWNSVSPDRLRSFFGSTDKLKSFLDVELRVVVQYLKQTKGLKLKESSSKMTKTLGIAEWLEISMSKIDNVESQRPKRSIPRKVKTLAEISTKVIERKINKFELNVMHAEYLWPRRYEEWITEIQGITINGQSYDWFYKPEFSQSRNQYEVRCIDSTHLMTRIRRKSCKVV